MAEFVYQEGKGKSKERNTRIVCTLQRKNDTFSPLPLDSLTPFSSFFLSFFRKEIIDNGLDKSQ